MQDPITEELNSSRKNKYHVDKLNEDQLLYHYTSLQGLRGILTSKVFFATEGKFLNDSGEIKYIKKILNLACDKVQADLDPGLINEIRWFNNDVQWLETINVFVLSLSEHSDSLILWSNYGKHDGYNIGINPYDLEMVFFHETHEFREINQEQGEYVWLDHGKVIYDYDKQISIVIDELYNLNKLYDKLDRPLQRIAEFSYLFFSRMQFYSAFFKDFGFRDECEYRLAITSNKNFSSSVDGRGGFREVDGCLLPYFKIPVHSKNAAILSPIKEITIGPKINLDIAEVGLELFKNEFGFNDVSIKQSAIPLRY